jgi:site-specific recombinase XerD
MKTGSALPDHGSRTAADIRADTLTTPVGQRKLHLGHFAFMRALIQGVDTRASWNRYLRIEGEHSDTATVRRTIAWLRDEFTAAARRWQRHGAARLVLVDIASAAKDAPALPSLADFIAERGLDDFSEAEQLAAYHAEHGNATGRGSRRARLIGRQLETLRWLEGLIAEPPRAADTVSAWLHPDLAARLERAGVTTLDLLIDRINGLGSGWYRALPAIGVTKAARVVDWLRAHEATIGRTVGTHATMPRASLSPARLQAIVPPAMGIVPLEKLIVPDTLSGADGLYRLPRQRCLIRATNDHEAILAWVRARQGASAKATATQRPERDPVPGTPEPSLTRSDVLSHTQRAYLKEAERFFLWAIVQRQKPLSSMTLEDCIAYRDFLADPQPAALWCGPRGRPRWSPLWRPFEGPLSASAQRRSIAILKSLYGFLADQCYLQWNPLACMTLPGQSRAKESERSVSPAQWAFMQAEVNALPQTSANRRLKFTLMLLHDTGLRISEAVSARVAALTCQPCRYDTRNATEVWTLAIAGNAGKERRVPISSNVVAELQSYLASRGLPAVLSAVPGEACLLGRAVDVTQRASWSPAARTPVDRLAGIGTATLHAQLKNFFSACARKIRKTDPTGAQLLVKASAHWMRHTHGFHAVATGMSLKTVQQNLGHASLASTTRYVAGDARQLAALRGTPNSTASKAPAK